MGWEIATKAEPPGSCDELGSEEAEDTAKWLVGALEAPGFLGDAIHGLTKALFWIASQLQFGHIGR